MASRQPPSLGVYPTRKRKKVIPKQFGFQSIRLMSARVAPFGVASSLLPKYGPNSHGPAHAISTSFEFQGKSQNGENPLSGR